jgi:hypothetical protein
VPVLFQAAQSQNRWWLTSSFLMKTIIRSCLGLHSFWQDDQVPSPSITTSTLTSPRPRVSSAHRRMATSLPSLRAMTRRSHELQTYGGGSRSRSGRLKRRGRCSTAAQSSSIQTGVMRQGRLSADWRFDGSSAEWRQVQPRPTTPFNEPPPVPRRCPPRAPRCLLTDHRNSAVVRAAPPAAPAQHAAGWHRGALPVPPRCPLRAPRCPHSNQLNAATNLRLPPCPPCISNRCTITQVTATQFPLPTPNHGAALNPKIKGVIVTVTTPTKMFIGIPIFRKSLNW